MLKLGLEGEILRNKIKFLSKMMKFNKTLRFVAFQPKTEFICRQQSETIAKLKGLCPANRIPVGLLQEGGTALKDGNNSWEICR